MDHDILLLVWGMPSLMHHESQLKLVKNQSDAQNVQPTGRASISELDSSYLDQHVLLLVWGVPSLMHHGSQLRSLKTTDWLLTALWLQTFWFHQVNKVIPLYISSYRILPQHLGSHALRFHEFIWNHCKFITLTFSKLMPFVIVWSLCCSVQWPCNVLCILLIISKIFQGHWIEWCEEQNISNGLSLHGKQPTKLHPVLGLWVFRSCHVVKKSHKLGIQAIFWKCA